MKKSSKSSKTFERYPIWLLIFNSQDQIHQSHLGLLQENLSTRIEESLSKLCERLCEIYIDQKDILSSKASLPPGSSFQRPFPSKENQSFERYGHESVRKRSGADEGFLSKKKPRTSTSYFFTNSDKDDPRSPPAFEKGLIDRFKFSKKVTKVLPQREGTNFRSENLSTRSQTRVDQPRVSVKRLVSIGKENKNEAEEDSRRPEWITRSLTDYRNPVFGGQQPLTKKILQTKETKSPNPADNHEPRNQFEQITEVDRDSKTIIDLSGLTNPRKFKLIGQADRKLIVVYFKENEIIVVFDQHAIDERIRIERFFKQIILLDLLVIKKIGKIDKKEELKGVGFGVDEVEFEGFMRWKKRFKRYGFRYECKEGDGHEVWVMEVPELLFKRLEKDGFKGLGEVMRMCLGFFETHQEEKEGKVWDKGDWMNGLKFMPEVLVGMLNSKACRGSIMFGDRLNHQECLRLLNELKETSQPFLCAHGRINCIPILKLTNHKHIKKNTVEDDRDDYFHEFLLDRFGFDLDWFMNTF